MNNYLKRKNDMSIFEDSSSLKEFFQMPFFKHDTMLKTDIIETKDSYTLVVDAPGCTKDDVKIINEDGYLTIEITQNSNSETTNSNYLKKERMHGSYSRSYYIGNSVDSKSINASFTNGVLHISFPKEKTTSNTTYIPIKGN